jgi:hypothetical protein
MWTFDQVVRYLKPWEIQIHKTFTWVKDKFVVEVIKPAQGPFYCDYCDEDWSSYEVLLIATEVRKLRPQRPQKTRFDRILEDD